MIDKEINITFVSPPKKYNCIFNTETEEVSLKKHTVSNNNIGKGSFINGNLFFFWSNGESELIFYYRNCFYSSDDTKIKIVLNELDNSTIKYMYVFKIFKNNIEIESDLFVSQAYNKYLVDVTYDDFDLEEDEILISFYTLWNTIRQKTS